MQVRLPLYAKILAWFFLNFLLIGALLLAAFDLHFRFAPDFLLLGTVQSITLEIKRSPREGWDAILQRHSEIWKVEFILLAENGERLAGGNIPIPVEGRKLMTSRSYRPSGWTGGGPPPGVRFWSPRPIFAFQTENPRFYWVGVRLGLFGAGLRDSQPNAILVRSASRFGNGLFFDPKPWIVLAFAVFGLSALVWLPFARGLTRSIRQLTEAATHIADEKFDVRVNESRTDELGKLGKAINRLAIRIAGFVGGQKRFLGDVAHELNSPLGRLQVALGILEQRCEPDLKSYIADAQEEIQMMSKLIGELLMFSKAGIRAAETKLESVTIANLLAHIIAREATAAEVCTDVPPDLAIRAHPDLLARALANLIRNATQYAGHAGPIVVSALRYGDKVRLTISDLGDGVPESEVGKLFDPFYRLESDRSRATGGSGLGLAIVKSCIEACGGGVSACNVKPRGFEVAITLTAAETGAVASTAS